MKQKVEKFSFTIQIKLDDLNQMTRQQKGSFAVDIVKSIFGTKAYFEVWRRDVDDNNTDRIILCKQKNHQLTIWYIQIKTNINPSDKTWIGFKKLENQPNNFLGIFVRFNYKTGEVFCYYMTKRQLLERRKPFSKKNKKVTQISLLKEEENDFIENQCLEKLMERLYNGTI